MTYVKRTARLLHQPSRSNHDNQRGIVMATNTLAHKQTFRTNGSMQRRHFELIAEIISKELDGEHREKAAYAFAYIVRKITRVGGGLVTVRVGWPGVGVAARGARPAAGCAQLRTDGENENVEIL